MTGLEVRRATEEDEQAVTRVVEASPDGGAVGFTPHDLVPADAVAAGLHESSTGVVAETAGAGVVGAARLSTGHCRIEGEVVQYGLLSSLVVHPDHRRTGVARALTGWRIARAEALAGPDVVILANIQRGNAASLANARAWATWTSPRAVTAPVPVRRRPPAPTQGLEFGEAGPDDLEEVAAGIARFSAAHALSIPWTAAGLQARRDASPLPEPVQHHLVARARRGRIVAGFALREQGRLQSVEITRIPRSIRIVDRLLHVIPADRVLRTLAVDSIWFAPGQLRAAQALWEDTRWRWRDRGTTLLATVDPRSPAHHVLGLRPWSPTTDVTVAVRAPRPMRRDRIVEPLL